MLVTLLLAVFAIVWRCPDTLLGKALWRYLVDWPAQGLARLTKRKLVIWTAGLALVLGAIVAAKLFEDGMMFAQFVPEGIGWIAAVDVTGYFEIIAAVWLVARLAPLRAAHKDLTAAATRARQWMARRLQPAIARFGRAGASLARQVRARIARSWKGDDEDGTAPDFLFA